MTLEDVYIYFAFHSFTSSPKSKISLLSRNVEFNIFENAQSFTLQPLAN